MDTNYLKDTVGDALTRGCAATATVRPGDPVEYLANWLHKYVKNEAIKDSFFAEKAALKASEESEKAATEAAEAAEQSKRTSEAEAVDSLTSLVEDPFVLFAKVAEVVEANTSAGMVYIGSLQPDERALPELAEDDDGEDVPEPEDVGEEPEPEAGEEEEGGDPFKYQEKHLAYVSSSLGAEFMVGKELRRPTPSEEEDAPVEKAGVTFAITDESVPVVDVPNVLYALNDVKFFKPVPKVGAYYAQALANAASGEVKAVLAADTTIPMGKGKPFTPADKEFMTRVAAKVSKCLESIDTKLVEYVAAVTEAHAPPPPPAEGEGEGEGEGEAAPAEEAAAEEAADGEGPTEEAEETSAIKLEKAKAALGEAAAAIANVQAESVRILKLYQSEPPATASLLRGVLALFANSTADVATLKWPALREKVLGDSEFFDSIAAFDASAEGLSEEVATFLRRSYVTLKARELWRESPLGEPLKDFIVKARAVVKIAAVVAEEEAAAAAAAAEAEAAAAAEAEAPTGEGEEGAEAEEPAAEA